MASNRSAISAETEASMARQASGALAWSYGLTVLKLTSSFALGIVLARILGPGPFGLVAAAFLPVGIGLLVVDAGAGSSLIQRDSIKNRDISAAATWQFIIAILMTVAVFLLATPLSSLFGTSGVVPVIRVMSLFFLFQAPGMVPTALLRRQMNHRRVLFITTASYVLMYGALGIPLAEMGFGVWSLVAAQLSQVALASLLLFVSEPHAVRFVSPGSDRKLMTFGSQILATNCVNWLIENGDNLLVGMFLGIQPLGLYSRAYTTARLPADSLVQSLGTVIFPSVARRSSNLESVRRTYLALLNSVVLVSVIGFITVATLARPIVNVLLGGKWLGASVALTPLAIAMIFHCIVAVTGPFLWAIDAVRSELSAQVATTVCAVPIILMLHGSLFQVGLAVAIIYAIRMATMLAVLERRLRVSLRALLRAITSGFAAGLPIVAADLLVAREWGSVSAVLGGGVLACGVLLAIAVSAPCWIVTDATVLMVEKVTARRDGTIWRLLMWGIQRRLAEGDA